MSRSATAIPSDQHARTSALHRTRTDHRPQPPPPRPGGPALRSSAARLVLWRLRRPAAAVCAGLAAFLALQVLGSPGPPTAPVLVAARDLPAGTTLTEADLTRRDLLRSTVPAGASTDSAELLGARTAVPVPAGLPLVPGLLTDTSATGPPGTVVVPVRFADDSAAILLTPGRRIDVVSAPIGGEARTVATGALVLTAPATEGGGGLLGGSDPGTGPLLLAVDPAQAVELSAAGASTGLSAILVE